ncbi:hypothetical protein GCM10027036_40810 [Flavihumibacter cheonanensis]
MDLRDEQHYGSFRCMISTKFSVFTIVADDTGLNTTHPKDIRFYYRDLSGYKITLFMKKMSQFLMVLIAGCVVFSSCRKNDDGPSSPTPLPENMKWVKKVVAGPNDYYSYTYSDQKKLGSYTSKWVFSPEGPIIRTYEVSYQYQDGKVKEAVTQSGGKQLFFYKNNQLDRSEFYFPNGEKYADHQYMYNNIQQLTEIIETIVEPIEVSQVRTQLFYDSKGNLTKRVNQQKMKGANQFQLTSTLLVEQYDTKYHTIPAEIWGQFLPGLILHRNNPIRFKELLPNGTVHQIIHMSYEYDANGFPTARIQHIEMNGQHKPSIRYDYEY